GEETRAAKPIQKQNDLGLIVKEIRSPCHHLARMMRKEACRIVALDERDDRSLLRPHIQRLARVPAPKRDPTAVMCPLFYASARQRPQIPIQLQQFAVFRLQS